MALPFLDTNIFLRHLTQDHPEQSPRATNLLEKIERGEVRAQTTDIVVFEVVFTLQRLYKKSKQEIRDNILPLLELSGLMLPGKVYFHKIFDLYVDLNIPFADAYIAVQMERNEQSKIYSFDLHFDKIPNVERIEP